MFFEQYDGHIQSDLLKFSLIISLVNIKKYLKDCEFDRIQDEIREMELFAECSILDICLGSE